MMIYDTLSPITCIKHDKDINYNIDESKSATIVYSNNFTKDPKNFSISFG